VREPYRDWANATIDRIRNVLEGARAEHTQAVKDRISSVEQMKDVVSITQGLFALSKVEETLSNVFSCLYQWSAQETAKLESEAFVQQQKVALASEVKAVLDSWVRYEQQVKESEQADLSRTVIEKVLASIKDEKTQKDVLASAVAEVECALAEAYHEIIIITDNVCHPVLVKNKAI
jgi:F-type H+-transporting ATPase subunit b